MNKFSERKNGHRLLLEEKPFTHHNTFVAEIRINKIHIETFTSIIMKTYVVVLVIVFS